MSKLFMPDVTAAQRRQIMSDTALKADNTPYYMPLTQEEIDQRRELHTDNCIKLSDLQEEKKRLVADVKAKIDPLALENSNILQEIRSRQAKVDGVLYSLPDYTSGMMEIYDDNGELFSSRKLLPTERQGNLLRKAE